MVDSAINGLVGILAQYSWVGQLAGILPLSALIDFIDIPLKLHVFQLVGAAPLWSWPITPAGSRLLLSDDKELQRSCCLDRYGKSVSMLGLDGRYGASYVIANPETARLCIGSLKTHAIDNPHENMKGEDLRIQTLEIIRVSRILRPPGDLRRQSSSSWRHRAQIGQWRVHSLPYLATSVLGWVLLLATVTMSAILQTYIALAFLVVVPATGIIVFALYGSTPRGLLVSKPVGRSFSRLILVAEHVNSTHWIVFYGESILVNSLLNRPLEPRGRTVPPKARPVLQAVLRVLILGQWAMALAASATQNWNSYIICFWIAVCIFLHAFVIPVHLAAADWMTFCAGIQMDRYETTLSSRRALLNTVLALNPDAFALDLNKLEEDREAFCGEALRWMDAILKPGPARTRWLEASLKAMKELRERESDAAFPSPEWTKEYANDYWSPFIPEGIEAAQRIRHEANLPERIITL